MRFFYLRALVQRWMLTQRFSPLTWNHAYTSVIPVEPLMPFWTVNLEGLSALVWHTFSLQLIYNSEQNYTKPITMWMRVKNQSYVCWRSVSRHFIRSLRVEFYSCTFLTARVYWPCGFSRKVPGADTDLECRGARSPLRRSLEVSYCTAFRSLYHLKHSVMHMLPGLRRLQALRILTTCHYSQQYLKKKSFKMFLEFKLAQ